MDKKIKEMLEKQMELLFKHSCDPNCSTTELLELTREMLNVAEFTDESRRVSFPTCRS